MLFRSWTLTVAGLLMLSGCAISTSASPSTASDPVSDSSIEAPSAASAAASSTAVSTVAASSTEGLAVDLDELGLRLTLPAGFEQSEPDPDGRLIYLAVRSDPSVMTFGVIPCADCADVGVDDVNDWELNPHGATEVEVDGVPALEAFNIDTNQVDAPVGNMLIVLNGDRSFMLTMVGVDDIDAEWQSVLDSISIDDS